MSGFEPPQHAPSTLPPPAPLTSPPMAPNGPSRNRGDGPESESIQAWQRIWIVLAVMMVAPAIGNISAAPVRVVFYSVAAVVVLAAMGVVELAMALWYRARRR